MSRPVKREEPEGENEEERGRSLHTAPGYDGTSTKFDQYEKLVDAYRRLGKLNKVPNAEIALKLFSSLKGKAQNMACELDMDSIEADNGVDYLMGHLKRRIKGEEEDRDLESVLGFDRCWRRQGQTVSDFVAEFEKKYTEVSACGLTMSEKMRGIILLVRCRIDDATIKLVKSAAVISAGSTKALTIEAYTSALNRVVPNNAPVVVRKEMVLMMDQDQEEESGQGSVEDEYFVVWDEHGNAIYLSKGKGPKGGGKDKGGKNSHWNNGGKRKNPIDKRTGKPSVCACCGSDEHWLDKCKDPRAAAMRAERDAAKKMHFTASEDAQEEN